MGEELVTTVHQNMLLFAAETRFAGLLSHAASLKMKSDRFEKASEEIGVPRGKKSERYRSTPHYRSRSLVLALRKRLRKSGYREGRKASATAQPLTDRQTDTIYSGSELQSTHGRPTRIITPFTSNYYH